MKKAFKVFCWVILGFLAFCALIATLSDDDSSASSTEQAQETQSESFLGTYEVTDKVGTTIRITLNEDKTATIIVVGQEDFTYYCSWDDQRNIDRGILISYDGEKPSLVYEGGEDSNVYLASFIKDGWLWADDGIKSKNPRWKLKATKIK